MLKKDITFEDLDGNKVTETFYFNLNKAEVAELELSEAASGGMSDLIKKVVAETDGKKLVEMFKDIIIKSVGLRGEDGRKFIKNQQIIDDFTQTNAYSELFIEMLTNTDFAVEFFTGIMPADLTKNMEANIAQLTAEQNGEVEAKDTEAKVEDYSRQELLDMSQEDFDRLAGTDPSKMAPAVLQVAYQRKSQAKTA